MKNKYPGVMVIMLIATLITGSLSNCKKIDIVRIGKVITEPVTIVYTNGASIDANIIDLGEEESLDDYGFCWIAGDLTPEVGDAHLSLGTTSVIGYYTATINGLTSNTDYNVRSFVKDGNGIQYGNTESFHTLPGGGSFAWLHYDDGNNFTSIGMNDGSSFDIAVRFPTQALTQYNGFRISRFRFFAAADALFHVEIYDGTTPNLVYYEDVPSPVINGWTEYSPTNQYYINSATEVWAGIWIIDYVIGTYPAGVDDGPAISGAGDMISFDHGITWESLFVVNNNYNYNWNLQVYVTNQKGEEFVLTHDFNPDPKEKSVPTVKNPGAEPVAGNSNLNN
jgi:hypothetical protein